MAFNLGELAAAGSEGWVCNPEEGRLAVAQTVTDMSRAWRTILNYGNWHGRTR